MSRWKDLQRQPSAKWIKVYNNADDFDTGHAVLVSKRYVPDFDHLMDDVIRRFDLQPSGQPHRKLYTALGGTPVKDMSQIVSSKEYAAAPKVFKAPPAPGGHK